jgi:hypothetical protein
MEVSNHPDPTHVPAPRVTRANANGSEPEVLLAVLSGVNFVFHSAKLLL